jgi:hypothetical protein
VATALQGIDPRASLSFRKAGMDADALMGWRYAQMNQPPEPTDEMRNAEHFGSMAPDDPRRAYGPRTNAQNLTTVDKKEIFSSEDELTNLDATLEQLKAAEGLNDKTISGFGAGALAAYGAKAPSWMVPDRLEQPAKDTVEWQKLMEPEAIKIMANTLKGATTDFELNKFVDLLSDPSTPRPTRKNVIKRMIALAKRKRELANERIQELRGGSYFRPGGGLSGVAAPNAAPVSNAIPVPTMNVAPDGSMTPTQADMGGMSTGPQKLPREKSQLQPGQVYDFPDGRQGLWNGSEFEVLN